MIGAFPNFLFVQQKNFTYHLKRKNIKKNPIELTKGFNSLDFNIAQTTHPAHHSLMGRHDDLSKIKTKERTRAMHYKTREWENN